MNKCKILVILISYLMMIASLFAFNGGVAAFEKICDFLCLHFGLAVLLCLFTTKVITYEDNL